MRPCPTVRPSVGPLVGPSVTLSSKSMKNGLLRILNDSDEKERGSRRKQGPGGKRDDGESEKMKKL